MRLGHLLLLYICCLTKGLVLDRVRHEASQPNNQILVNCQIEAALTKGKDLKMIISVLLAAYLSNIPNDSRSTVFSRIQPTEGCAYDAEEPDEPFLVCDHDTALSSGQVEDTRIAMSLTAPV